MHKFATLLVIFVVALSAVGLPLYAQDEILTYISGSDRVMGTLVTFETFDAEDAWEHYSNPMGVELGVEDGVYRAYTMNGGYVWGLNSEEHTDIILEVEATPMNLYFGNGYGVMCRADEAGDGYYFMINANGYFSIAKGDGDYILPLVDWQESDAIRPHIDRNSIRAACVEDTLTMFVNDELVAEVTDTTFSAGFAGLSVAGAANTDADVVFDNLAIYLPITLH